MGAMNRLSYAIEEQCGICSEIRGCENCRMRLDIGDRIIYVKGKTKQIIGSEKKSELARVGEFILSCMKVTCIVLMLNTVAYAEVINVDKLADAIYIAEGGANTSHPYGILKKYKVTTPRQACINTINHGLKNWDKRGDFIEFLGSRYCPVGAKNDPTGLNKNWIRNVKYYYNH